MVKSVGVASEERVGRDCVLADLAAQQTARVLESVTRSSAFPEALEAIVERSARLRTAVRHNADSEIRRERRQGVSVGTKKGRFRLHENDLASFVRLS